MISESRIIKCVRVNVNDMKKWKSLWKMYRNMRRVQPIDHWNCYSATNRTRVQWCFYNETNTAIHMGGQIWLGSSVKVQFRYSEKYRETSRLQETLGKSALKLVFFRFRALSIAHQYNFSYNPNPEQVSGLKWWVGEGGGEMGFPNKPVYYAIFQLYTQALAFFLVLRVCLV